jgi:hypothetical protein
MAGACNVLEHNLRKKIFSTSYEITGTETIEVPDYLDADSMKFNTMQGCLSREEFCIEYQRKLDEAKLERKIQRNASRIIETVISSSHAFCEDWKTNPDSKATVKQYLEDAVRWEKARHGNFDLSVSYHWDESSPHCHILSVPLVPYIDKLTHEQKIKFSASEFFGGKGDLIKMHTDFHEKVGKKYGLERGQCGSRASHKELKDYKNWEREQRELLLVKEASLIEKERQVQEYQLKVSENEIGLLTREKDLKKKEFKVGFDAKVLQIKQNEFETVVVKANQDIPQIPEPPISLNRNKVKAWVDSVQSSITNAFLGIKAAYESMVSKYNRAVTEMHQLRSANKQLYEENVQINHILLHSPITEIQAHRDAVAKREKKPETPHKKQGHDEHGYSR